jgi:hypothetical protein
MIQAGTAARMSSLGRLFTVNRSLLCGIGLAQVPHFGKIISASYATSPTGLPHFEQ